MKIYISQHLRMEMQLHNTLTKRKQKLKPINPPEVKFYHCGPTVYWTQHIGNLRGMAMGDFIRRSLDYVGFKTDYVRNYTDVGHLVSDADEGEDKMEKGAKREGKTPQEIAEKYIKIFEKDIKELNLLEPTHKSKVTTCMNEIIKMIQTLLDKGVAYTTPKAIYFDVTKSKDYPAFSKKKLEDQIEGAGSGDITDKNKRHPADFAIWFFKTGAHKNALQYWPSPFQSEEVDNGEGFPGWHIECSVIAKKFLGETIDIHMGGVEHIAIHHPNEIAQSEAANDGKIFSHIWLHNEHLTVDGKKMSKSAGTSFSLEEIKSKGFDPMDLRYFFLQAQYRSKQNFTWEALEASQTARKKLIEFLKNCHLEAKGGGTILPKYKEKFIQAISDDVNTPQALAIVWEIIKSDEKPEDKLATILDFDKIFGLNLSLELQTKIKMPTVFSDDDVTRIETMIKARKEAREDKNFEEADEIRNKLKEKYNVTIKDTDKGTEWFEDIQD